MTISIDRAFEHLRSNSDGSPRQDMAYRIDPDPRSRNVFRGEIKGGMAAVTQHGDQFRFLQNPMVARRLDLQDFHALQDDQRRRRAFQGDFWAGYQPCMTRISPSPGVGLGGEEQVTGDIPGFYHLMKRYADADRTR